MTYNPHQILFGLQNQRGWEGLLRYMYEGVTKFTQSLVRKREGKSQLENLSLNIITVEKYLKK